MRSPLRRALLEVEVAGQREWVTVTLGAEGDEPRASTPDGSTGGPYVEAALAILGLGVKGQPPSVLPERTAFRRASLPPPEDPGHLDEGGMPLAVAFEDLVTAVARVGVDEAAEAPSVLAARERLVAAASSPLPLGLARYLGRLKGALVARDVVLAALLLEEASRFTRAARQGTNTRRDRERSRAFLGTGEPGHETISDRVMVELSREWVAGTERGSLERRLLADVETGALHFETRTRQGAISLGPCPRTVRVGLAEVESGPAPQTLRVMQYEVSAGLAPDVYDDLLAHAEDDVAAVRARYQDAIEASPGLAEPFVILAPVRLVREGELALMDAAGETLALADVDAEGRSAALEGGLEGSLEWVVGALHERSGRFALDPHGYGARTEGTPRYVRLR